MRGPIDYIIVGFEGNKFDGSIMNTLADAIKAGTIGLVDLALVSKDAKGKVSEINIADVGDGLVVDLVESQKAAGKQIGKDDINEMTDLLENNTSAGLLVIEHLWAKPLKEALIKANGILIADGRIHPDAAAELDKGKGK